MPEMCWVVVKLCSYTWALSRGEVHLNCLKQKHHTTRTAKGCQKLFLSDWINLHFHEPELKCHKTRATVGKDATQLLGTWGCLLGSAQGGWAFLSSARHVEQERAWIQGNPVAKWQLVIFPERSALQQELQRCVATSATAEHYRLSPPPFWPLFSPQTIGFSQKCQSKEWLEEMFKL